MEDVSCEIVVDTGASVTLIHPRIINAATTLTSPNGLKSFITVKTVTGEIAPVIEQRDVVITIGYQKFRHRVLIVEIYDQVILGLDFLHKHNCIVNIGTRTLSVNNDDIILNERSNQKDVNCELLCIEDTLVPGMSEKIILCNTSNIPSSSIMMVSPIYENNEYDRIMCARTLIDVSNSCIPIRVMNVCERRRIIKKGEVIGECIPISLIRNVNVNKVETVNNNTNLPIYLKDLYNRSCNNLNENQKIIVFDLLRSFTDIFSKDKNDNGRCHLTKHFIDVGDSRPIKQPARRLPIAKKKEVEELVKTMEVQGVIERSSSPWSSPIVLVTKKDGSTRFCVDYRKLNQVTKKDSYPLPRIDDTLDAVAGSQWYSTLDLQSGYWQVPINPTDKEKTAFVTPGGLWQFNVMPFGLTNAPATFERLMELVLKGLPWQTCLMYLDDVIIHSKMFDVHIQNLKDVFNRLKLANLKLNPNKCNLFQREVIYLGHIVSCDGIKTDPSKSECVRLWPKPKNVHELRSFLGLCSYYRRFVQGFSSIAKPLFNLTENKKPFIWTDETEKSFNDLKNKLTSSPILSHPDSINEFILDTDASQIGIGAVLSQERNGIEYVIAYFSKTMSKAERNYCVTRRELLAIVKSVQHFHHYLYGQKFKLRTDHSALTWLMNFKEPEGQLARWMERLQQYNFVIEHRPGKCHNNADALSRRPCIEMHCQFCTKAETHQAREIIALSTVEAINIEGSFNNDIERLDWQNLQRRDPELNIVLGWLTAGEKPSWQSIAMHNTIIKGYWMQWNSLLIENSILYRCYERPDDSSFKQIVVPRSKGTEIIRELHDNKTGGHFGISRTYEKLRQRFYWINCRADVKKWCIQCDICSARKGPKHKSKGPMQQYIVGAPFERVAVDVLGPLPRTNKGNRYLLMVMDYFSKWPEVIPMPNQEAETVADALVKDIVSRHGVPLELHSDQGRNFESTVFKNLMTKLGIRKTRTTPLHPQSDGMVERLNRTIAQYLSKFVSQNQRDWDELIPFFLLSYRSCVHEATNETPAAIIYGRELKLPIDLVRPRPPRCPLDNNPIDEYSFKLRDRLERIHNYARENIWRSSERVKNNYNLNINNIKFDVNQLVWLYNPIRQVGICTKLLPKWNGPYTVIKQINDVIYKIRKGQQYKIVHMNRLAPYHGRATRTFHNRRSVTNLSAVRDEQA